jgi:glycosyltransferase involved in cell wall biosynthesis
MIENSIIIPVRNQKESLFLCLASLKKQIKKPRVFEIVICDDGSTDGTGEAVKKLKYPIFFKYFKNDPPLGRAANRNRGFEKSSGSKLVFLDGDMVPDEKYVDSMLGGADNETVRLGVPKPPPDMKQTGLEKYLYSRGRYSSNFRDTILPGRYFTSNSFYISRENFAKSGGFDTNFKGWGGEDIDFGLRLDALGIPIKNIPQAVTYHHHKRTLNSLVADFYDFGRDSFAYLIQKHPRFFEQLPSQWLGLSSDSEKVNIFKRLISGLTINRFSLKAAEKLISRWSDSALPDFLFDYVLWGNLALGYKERGKPGKDD